MASFTWASRGAALFPTGCTVFLHDPVTGDRLPNMLNIWDMHVLAHTEQGGLRFPGWDLLIISLRDPITRTISAFNYGLDLPDVQSNTLRDAMNETCYPTVPGAADAFARSLDEDTRCGAIARRCLHSVHGSVTGARPCSVCGGLVRSFRAPCFYSAPRAWLPCQRIRMAILISSRACAAQSRTRHSALRDTLRTRRVAVTSTWGSSTTSTASISARCAAALRCWSAGKGTHAPPP